jgi:hypothetical protein
MPPVDDTNEGWIRAYLQPRYPELVKPYRDAVAIAKKASEQRAISAPALARLLEYARSPRTPLGENAASMLGDLFNHIAGVGEAIRNLAEGKAMHERINALVALSNRRVRPLHSELFEKLLRDRSSRVRELTADKIQSHKLKKLVGPLAAAVLREKNAEVREAMRGVHSFLTRGFNLRKYGDKSGVTYWKPVARMYVLEFFKSGELEAKEPGWIERWIVERGGSLS